MTDTAFTWAVTASLGTHLVGLAAASALGIGAATAETPPAPVPIEVVRTEPAAPPPPPPAPPPPRSLAPKLPSPPRAPERQEIIENRLAVAPPTLLDESREPQGAPTPAPPESRFLTGNSLMSRSMPPQREGTEAGAGRLLDTGDIPVRPGRGLAGGSGASGRGGTGSAARGGSPVEAGGPGGGTLTSLAHPLGGYQHMPAYPESARRQGVEGVTTLRFQVLTDGSVGEVAIARSAGDGELDQAAVEAIRKWRFEPARRGKDAVVVWVTLPVRFELRNQ